MDPPAIHVLDMFDLLIVCFVGFAALSFDVSKLRLGRKISVRSTGASPSRFLLTDEAGNSITVDVNLRFITLESGEKFELSPFVRTEPISINGHEVRLEYTSEGSISGRRELMYKANGFLDWRLAILLRPYATFRLIHVGGYTIVYEAAMVFCVCHDPDASLNLVDNYLVWPGRLQQLMHDILSANHRDTVEIRPPHNAEGDYCLVDSTSRRKFVVNLNGCIREILLVGGSCIVVPRKGAMYEITHSELAGPTVVQNGSLYAWYVPILRVIPLAGGYYMFMVGGGVGINILVTQNKLGHAESNGMFNISADGSEYCCTIDNAFVTDEGPPIEVKFCRTHPELVTRCHIEYIDDDTAHVVPNDDTSICIEFALPDGWLQFYDVKLFRHRDNGKYIMVQVFPPMVAEGWVRNSKPSGHFTKMAPRLEFTEEDE